MLLNFVNGYSLLEHIFIIAQFILLISNDIAIKINLIGIITGSKHKKIIYTIQPRILRLDL